VTRKSANNRKTADRRFAPFADRADLAVRKTADPIDSYHGRFGYQEDFIGAGSKRVPLPGLGEWRSRDRAAYRTDEPSEYVLRYEHFSVVVSCERRMPLFSAVNIAGGTRTRRISRTNVWKLDPRISAEYQILTECYGREDEGYFSRGHMTRREDANWGTKTVATRADADTFHVTNAVPQAQSFNSPVWLGLEQHLLTHTNQDDMKVSVITGPVFGKDDLEMFGVRVPSQFWKIIAFMHDRTGALSVTAYLASQAAQIAGLREAQFVFGRFRDWQVPMRRIARLTGLDFGALAGHDPLARADERFALELRRVSDVFTV
jgi:endonuclease G, mitochondrial